MLEKSLRPGRERLTRERWEAQGVRIFLSCRNRGHPEQKGVAINLIREKNPKVVPLTRSDYPTLVCSKGHYLTKHHSVGKLWTQLILVK